MSTSAAIGDNAKQQLLAIIERVENVETEIKGLSQDRSDIYAEAKGQGYDVPALKAIVRARRENADKRREREAHYETYSVALGMD